jgi:hypothetical protein
MGMSAGSYSKNGAGGNGIRISITNTSEIAAIMAILANLTVLSVRFILNSSSYN